MLETEGEPGGEVVHVFTGRGLFQEISGEEMRRVNGESEMAVDSPLEQRLGLVAHITRVAGRVRILLKSDSPLVQSDYDLRALRLDVRLVEI